MVLDLFSLRCKFYIGNCSQLHPSIHCKLVIQCYIIYNDIVYYSNLTLDLSLQDWFAFNGNGSDFNFTLVGEAFFPNSGTPTAHDNYGFCQVSVFGM